MIAAAAVAAGERNAPRRHTVTTEGNAFRPADLTVDRGDTVVWVNRDFYPHTTTENEGHFDSGAIPAKESWELTIEASGDLRYSRTLHPTMTARLPAR